MIEQLSLFESIFDEGRAKWHPNADKLKYCDVLANIPSDAMSHTENVHFQNGFKDKSVFDKAELWENVCLAIWRYHNCHWEKAMKLLKEHRDQLQPIRMRIYQYELESFKQIQVVEYLD